nr:MAG TPA: hypothetical protein [Caudoviricetes sp.]
MLNISLCWISLLRKLNLVDLIQKKFNKKGACKLSYKPLV